ncbi:hypothetical protein B0A52_10175 [Exophiala mesophila]|uniref:DNA repair protein REV1 n=1 Tax=Exophiala mesophila TaxID=212818 RepID=A0A438MTC5_EXOME|nr:hypothetical protein B0A52_10175 [Exophiala mesophila]
MGSRLEKNSDLVRKRIDSHTFDNEEGEEYEGSKFGGFSDYMRRKKIKLQNLDAELRAASSQNPPIFRGIVAHVNGYTQPSLNDLHHLIVGHGGGFLQYLDGKTAVTHVIASHLTPKKTVEFARYRIVKPAWIVDSVNAGKLLPWDAYRVVDEGATQKVLAFDQGRVVSQQSIQRSGYKDQSDSSWYTSQIRKEDSTRRDESIPAQSSPPRPHTGKVFKSHEQDSDDTGPGNEDSTVLLDDSKDSLAPLPSNTTPQAKLNETVPLSAATANPEQRPLTAEEHNAILLSNPHMAKSSTANPDFLHQYYRESRLHHLSTWKAHLKAQLQARAQEKTQTQKFPHNRLPGSRRYIMHVDFDSFFAAVSLRKHPHLVDKPVVIAHGSGPGSEIASCNYPARKFGVKNGMWMKTALGLCPDLKVLPYDYKAYEEASRHFYDAILAIDGTVQSISIDEALIDVTNLCIKAGGSDGKSISEGSIYREQEAAEALARSLRESVKEKTACHVSVGIGNNILLAKVALRKAKPAGQHLIKPDEVLDFLGELLVTDLPGVAWSIGNKLEEIGIKYVKDIRACTKERLTNTLGPKTGEKLWDYSRGIDKQEVGDQVIRKSVSAEINWGIRFVNQQQAEDFVHSLCEELSRRLLEQLVKGKQLTMKIMRKAADAGMDPPKNLGHGKCDTFNKSVVLGVSTNDASILGKEAVSILRSYGFPPGELRGLGVQMQKLDPIKPATTNSNMFDSSQRRLQFKKPQIPAKLIDVKSTRPSAPASPTTTDMNPAVDSIEDIPTPEKPSQTLIIPSPLDVKPEHRDDGVDRTLLNISGTQFIMPTQIDPEVLAELPQDIRNKFAPRQATLHDTISRVKLDGSNKSRSASPYQSDPDVTFPTHSQLDPETLAALPEDVREEVLAQYRSAEHSGGTSMHKAQNKISPSKSKTKTFIGLKKGPTTPTKRQKVSTLLGRGKQKRPTDSSSTLTQSNFVSFPNVVVSDSGSTHMSDTISETFLNELPEDIRAEILAEQRRNRIQAKSGLNFEASRKRRVKTPLVDKGQQKLRLQKHGDRPTFTSQKLSTLSELRDATSAWVREFSSDGEGPNKEDVAALSHYLGQVVTEERDMSKALAIVNWLAMVIEYEAFRSDDIRSTWEKALYSLKRDVQKAVESRGLPPLVFDF